MDKEGGFMLDPRVLTFLCVCKHRNFTRAAQELNLTQPAVSQHIRYLEEHYQVPLFTYRSKVLSLTPQGEYLKGMLETLYHDVQKMQEEVSLIRQPEVLNIGATRSIGDYYLPRGLPAFLQAHPQLRLSVTVANTTRLLSLLDGGQVDLVLCEGYFDKNAYAHRLLRRERMCIFCGKDYPAEAVTRLEDLFSHPLLLREDGSGTREIFARFLRENNYGLESFSRQCSFNSPHIILQLLRAGQGISVLYHAVGSAGLAEGWLKEIPLQVFSLSHEFNAIWKKHSVFDQTYHDLSTELLELCE